MNNISNTEDELSKIPRRDIDVDGMIKATNEISKSSPTTIEGYVEDFDRKYTEKAQQSYKTAVADQVAPYRNQIETILDIRNFIRFALTSLRAETRRQFAEEVVEALENRKDVLKSTSVYNKLHLIAGIDESQKTVRSLSTSNQ